MNRWLPLLLLLLMSGAFLACAADPLPGFDGNQPIEVTAKRLEVLQQEHRSVFTGQVVVRQGDMTLRTEQLTVFFAPESEEIERFDALGQVEFEQLDRTAFADRAVYQRQQEILRLVGNARVKQGENVISGDEITLYIRENRSTVQSSSSNRVKAVIIPSSRIPEP